MKKKFCILVTKLTFGKVCFGWCVDPIKPKKEVKKTPKKKMSTGKPVKKKITEKEKPTLVLEKRKKRSK